MHTLIIATHNQGKLKELRALLSGLDVEVLAIGDVIHREFCVVEDGNTFEHNAIKKARAVADVANMLTLADDSGLEVDALGGAPGVRSARLAGEHATDAENNAALIALLDRIDASFAPFKARFRCVLALVWPNSYRTELVEGVCEGHVILSRRGTRGFGYDPLFIPEGVQGDDRTMAELSDDEKNRISHRARALKKLRLVLEPLS
ncbi:MAG: RdgB/HAM1 family non-canonical purine NTP pyrophosphatase [Polyangiaceae bacterium]|nr:RdgB/HAM1 family non-canonical purine NTP pyrophosphatase [Polyangiaceae bacterium]